jgi:hypothetical protein
MEAASTCSVTLYSFKSDKWLSQLTVMHACSWMSLPLVKETNHPWEKTHITNPIKNEHLHTAGHRYKQENSNLIWKRGMSDLYPYSMPGAQFIFSSFWLPSPRFELCILAGYSSLSVSSSRVKQSSWTWPLKMRSICCSKTSITNYQLTLCNITDEQRQHLIIPYSYIIATTVHR